MRSDISVMSLLTVARRSLQGISPLVMDDFCARITLSKKQQTDTRAAAKFSWFEGYGQGLSLRSRALSRMQGVASRDIELEENDTRGGCFIILHRTLRYVLSLCTPGYEQLLPHAAFKE